MQGRFYVTVTLVFTIIWPDGVFWIVITSTSPIINDSFQTCLIFCPAVSVSTAGPSWNSGLLPNSGTAFKPSITLPSTSLFTVIFSSFNVKGSPPLWVIISPEAALAANSSSPCGALVPTQPAITDARIRVIAIRAICLKIKIFTYNLFQRQLLSTIACIPSCLEPDPSTILPVLLLIR